MNTYVAYCLTCDMELSEQDIPKHNLYLCLDDEGNLINPERVTNV